MTEISMTAVEQYRCGARLTTIFEGTSQIQQRIISAPLPRSPLEVLVCAYDVGDENVRVEVESGRG